MIDQVTFEEFAPLALRWAKELEETILTRGFPLSANGAQDAVRVGVQDPERVRVMVMDRIPLPEDPRLAEASRRAQIITEATRAAAIGYGVIIRADSWGDRELLLHQLVHVAQCERGGGLEAFVTQYLTDRQTSPEFTLGALEHEARSLARELSRD